MRRFAFAPGQWSVVFGFGVWLLVACAGQPEVRRLGPRSKETPADLLARTQVTMIRVATWDGAKFSLYSPHVQGDTLVGVRDAGPPKQIPLDSIAYVDAYLAAPPGVSAAEWVRLAAFVAGIAAVGACILNVCPGLVSGGS